MNKTAVKNFAVWARGRLIADVRYRAGLVGITERGIQDPLPQSDATAEFYDIGTATPYVVSGPAAIRQRRSLAEAVRRLSADGGYDSAYRYIMEEAAYTWFNRLIAVRFMEVNDYLPGRVRVLSSESGKIEPDLVTNPFDAGLDFTPEEEKTVLRMKEDSRMDELFRLLFIKQCNALHEILPALFERTEDYTELLMNLSVVDREGVVWRLTHDIPEEDFNVEKGGQVEIIGWLYQYYNTEPKAQVFARPAGRKIRKEEIPAATQLFTPDWIVRYMVENSLGRLWLEHGAEMACGNGGAALRELWTYYLDEAEQEPEVEEQLAELRRGCRLESPAGIRVIDPCMGSGHILVYAFDVLMQIYESAGWERREAARSVVEHNLYGLDIDKRAYQLAYFAVMMKARQYDRRFLTRGIQPQVYYPGLDPELREFGSLLVLEEAAEQARDGQVSMLEEAEGYRRLLAGEYDVVVTNPPYMAVSNAGGRMREYVKENFPDSKSDLFACFIERCGGLVRENGYQAMITQHAWMFLSSFEKLRVKLQAVDTVNMAHLGPRAFEEISGEVVQTAGFVMRKSCVKGYLGTYCRLTEPNTQQGKEEMFLAGENRYAARQEDFSKIPGAPVAYWVNKDKISLFQNRTIQDIAPPRFGMSTSDNHRFVRLWHEIGCDKFSFPAAEEALVDKGKKWYPYNNGGQFRKWYGNNYDVVNWEHSGSEIKAFGRAAVRNKRFYFRPGITWTAISGAKIAVRAFGCGFIFSSAGFCVFSHRAYELLALLNSKVGMYFLRVFSPTMNFNVGDVAKIPVKIQEDGTEATRIAEIAERCVNDSRLDWDSYETSWDFKRHPLI